MLKKKSLKVNFIMNAILNMSSFIFPLITFPYVSRILLPEGTGKVSFATSLISYFMLFAQIGIPTYGVRACAKVRDNKLELTRTVQELLIINLAMSAVSYVVLFLALIFVPRLQEDRMLYLVVSMNIFFNAIGIEWLYKALEQYSYLTIRSIIFKFVALVAMFILVKKQEDYVAYGGITILAASASNILNFFHAHKYISMKPVGGYEFKRHLRMTAVFFSMACASTIYVHLDMVMLGFMVTDAEVGYYNAAVRIRSVLLSVVTSLGAVLLPRAAYYVEHSLMEEFRKISRKALHFVLLAATPIMLYFMLYAKQGIYFLSGEAYTNSILPMQIIMPTLLFAGLSNILGIQILVPLGRERTVLASEIAGAVVDLVINAILIPKYASVGAAIGTLVAEIVVLAVQYAALRNEVGEAFRSIRYWKILLALLASTLASFWVTRLQLGNFLTLVIAACFFFAVYGTVLLATKESFVMDMVQQFLRKRKRGSGKTSNLSSQR